MGICTYDAALFPEVISGYILISSLVQIRSYFKEQNKLDATNTGTMLVHAFCFISYMIATVAFMFSYNAFQLKKNDKTLKIHEWTGVAYYFLTCVSLTFLSYIIWALIHAPEEERFASLAVEEFDPDIDLQCRIWNALVKRRLYEVTKDLNLAPSGDLKDEESDHR